MFPKTTSRFCERLRPALIEDPAPFTLEISRYRKYGELLKNSVESYPMRNGIAHVTTWRGSGRRR